MNRLGIFNVSDLCNSTPKELLSLNSRDFTISEKDVDEIVETLSSYGLSLKERKGLDLIIEEIPIEKLELSNRTYNRLTSAGISNILQLTETSSQRLLKIRNFGIPDGDGEYR